MDLNLLIFKNAFTPNSWYLGELGRMRANGTKTIIFGAIWVEKREGHNLWKNYMKISVSFM